MALRLDSREFARDWVRKLSQGQREDAFLDTQSAGSRPALRKVVQTAPAVSAAGMVAGHATALASGLPALTDSEAARLLWLPDFAPFTSGACVYDKALVADPSIQPLIRTHEPASSFTAGPPEACREAHRLPVACG